MIPDYCEAITGYRCWNVHWNGLLIGQNQGEPWPPYAPMIGRCGAAISTRHINEGGEFVPPPIWDCRCGIHAYLEKSTAHARAETGTLLGGYGNNTIGAPDAVVWGEVKLWGKVIVHTLGYRAALAYPGELWCNHPAIAVLVANLYGVPCHYEKIERPEDELLNVDRIYFNKIPISYNLWGNKSVLLKTTQPSPPVVRAIQAVSLAQIKALAATPWQQAQAQIQARQLPVQTPWQEMWRDAFKLKKPAPASLYVNAGAVHAALNGLPPAMSVGGRGGKSALQQTMYQTYMAATQGKTRL